MSKKQNTITAAHLHGLLKLFPEDVRGTRMRLRVLTDGDIDGQLFGQSVPPILRASNTYAQYLITARSFESWPNRKKHAGAHQYHGLLNLCPIKYGDVAFLLAHICKEVACSIISPGFAGYTYQRTNIERCEDCYTFKHVYESPSNYDSLQMQVYKLVTKDFAQATHLDTAHWRVFVEGDTFEIKLRKDDDYQLVIVRDLKDMDLRELDLKDAAKVYDRYWKD